MKIFDISLTISPDLPVWPGDPKIKLDQVISIDEGANANLTHLSAGVHIGTHVDAPDHFMNDGRTVEQLSLDILNGPCYVTQVPEGVSAITSKILDELSIPPGVPRILFGTSNSQFWEHGETSFQEDYVAVTDDGADWLLKHDIQLVGIDYLSIAPYKDTAPTHRTLLKAGVVIVEGLNLSAINVGHYELHCLPLKLLGSEGAPARAILIQK